MTRAVARSLPGDLVNATIQKESSGHHTGWLTGFIGGLLLISLGLELLAQQVFGHTDVGTLLWALYLGFWSFVVGVTGFLFLTVQWLVETKKLRIYREDLLSPYRIQGPLTRTERTQSSALKNASQRPP